MGFRAKKKIYIFILVHENKISDFKIKKKHLMQKIYKTSSTYQRVNDLIGNKHGNKDRSKSHK
jgi:hypothetical protein